jgi:Gluconate 2-dehydrogenase subunit 3
MAALTEPSDLITRREAIARVSALLGGVALVGQGGLLSGCAAGDARPVPLEQLFTASDLALLDELAETILPETSTPGAKAAGVGPFMAMMVAEAYDAREQQIFRNGLVELERECVAMHGVSFMAASAAQRLALLEQLDLEQWKHMERLERRSELEAPAHYFRMIKELALLGYFTSEIGYTQAMRYVETPGRFEPCTTYTPGEKAWAPHA